MRRWLVVVFQKSYNMETVKKEGLVWAIGLQTVYCFLASLGYC